MKALAVDVTDIGLHSGFRVARRQSQDGFPHNRRSLFEGVAPAIAAPASMAVPTLAMPDVHRTTGCGTWPAYAGATLAFVFASIAPPFCLCRRDLLRPVMP